MDEPAQRFAQLCDEHIQTVYGFFAYRLVSRGDAEYLTAQTFEQALGAWESFDASQVEPELWLLSIARNLLIDHDRAAVPTAEQLGTDPELEAALARLDDREREVLALRFGADLTGADIAALTGLSVTDAQQITSRSLRRLRGELGAPTTGQRRQ